MLIKKPKNKRKYKSWCCYRRNYWKSFISEAWVNIDDTNFPYKRTISNFCTGIDQAFANA